MPKVPLYDQQVEQQGIPGARQAVPSDIEGALGGSVGKSLQNAGQIVAQVHLEETKKANRMATIGAETELQKYKIELLHHEKTGALTKTGSDAFSLQETVLSDYDKKIAEISNRLTNDDQRSEFALRANASRVDVDLSIKRHVSTQMVHYDNEQTNSYVEIKQQSAFENYSDPRRVALDINDQAEALAAYAERRGMSPLLAKLKIEKAKSDTHIGVIERMLSKDEDILAKTYFEEVKTEIDGRAVSKLEVAIDDNSLRGQSQRISDAITSSGVDRMGAINKAKKITDPKLRDEVETRLDREYARLEQAERKGKDDAFMRAQTALERSGGDLDSISSVDKASLSSGHRASLEERSRQIRAGVQPVHNDRVWLQFLADSGNGKVQKMSQADLYQLRPYLDNAHWDRASTLWAASRGEKAADKIHTTQALTFKDRFDSTIRGTRIIDPNKPVKNFSDDDVKTYGELEKITAHELEQFELGVLGGKRNATGDEIQKVIDKVLTQKVFVDRPWFNDKRKLTAQLTDAERAAAYEDIDNIPQEDKVFIRNIAKSRGKKISDDKIQRAYAQYLMGNVTAFDMIIEE